jgi:hypothetical protein
MDEEVKMSIKRIEYDGPAYEPGEHSTISFVVVRCGSPDCVIPIARLLLDPEIDFRSVVVGVEQAEDFARAHEEADKSLEVEIMSIPPDLPGELRHSYDYIRMDGTRYGLA